jgi:hypothetical protein
LDKSVATAERISQGRQFLLPTNKNVASCRITAIRRHFSSRYRAPLLSKIFSA